MEEKKNLTEDEIEFLLGGASKLSGKKAHPFPVEASKMKVGPFPAMDEVFERVSNILSHRLCELLGRSTTVKYTGTELERIGDTSRDLSSFLLHTLRARIGSSTWIVYIAEGRNMEDILKSKIGIGSQTALLKMVQEKMVEILLDTLQEEWNAIYPFSIEKLEGPSSVPPQHYRKDTPFLIPEFQMEIEGAVSEITLFIPLFAITSMGKAAKIRKAPELQGAPVPNERVRSFLESLDVEITFTLGRKKTTLKEIINLKPGSTIILTESRENQAYIELNGKEVFVCRKVSREGGKLKFQVEKEAT